MKWMKWKWRIILSSFHKKIKKAYGEECSSGFYYNEMWIIIIKLHAQRSFWKKKIINAFCWAFYCVNDKKKIE
jgi:hypothetical protein